MPSDRYPPFSNDTPVRTTHKSTPDSDWSAKDQKNRKWGVMGTIINHHDANGFFYEIEHVDGTIGTYDPAEFEVIK